jgi:hypothetical protein
MIHLFSAASKCAIFCEGWSKLPDLLNGVREHRLFARWIAPQDIPADSVLLNRVAHSGELVQVSVDRLVTDAETRGEVGNV